MSRQGVMQAAGNALAFAVQDQRRIKMKPIIKYGASIVLTLAVFLLVLPARHAAWSAQEENHCFTCHTNARKLIQITREIAKARGDKPGASAETEGEG
ncbi:MAG: hypothetical protein DRH17_11420 [Deltaproteobacteria bacterium]|nr:MAG: hypothetical protein DRH17_11420 [Deltaproteobacteria bacterium]